MSWHGHWHQHAMAYFSIYSYQALWNCQRILCQPPTSNCPAGELYVTLSAWKKKIILRRQPRGISCIMGYIYYSILQSVKQIVDPCLFLACPASLYPICVPQDARQADRSVQFILRSCLLLHTKLYFQVYTMWGRYKVRVSVAQYWTKSQTDKYDGSLQIKTTIL